MIAMTRLEDNSFGENRFLFYQRKLICDKCGCITSRNGKDSKYENVQKWLCYQCSRQPRCEPPEDKPLCDLEEFEKKVPLQHVTQNDIAQRINSSEKYFAPAEAAEILGVSRSLFHSWIKTRIVKCTNSKRISRKNLEAMVRRSIQYSTNQRDLLIVQYQHEEDRLFLSKDVVSFLGVRRETIKAWTKMKFLTSIRSGNRHLYRSSVIRATMELINERNSIEAKELLGPKRETRVIQLTTPMHCGDLMIRRTSGDDHKYSCKKCKQSVVLPHEITKQIIKTHMKNFFFKTYWIENPICESCNTFMRPKGKSNKGKITKRKWVCDGCKISRTKPYVDFPTHLISRTDLKIDSSKYIQQDFLSFQSELDSCKLRKLRPLEEARLLNDSLYACIPSQDLEDIIEKTGVDYKVSKTTFERMMKLTVKYCTNRNQRSLRQLAEWTTHSSAGILLNNVQMTAAALSARLKSTKLIPASLELSKYLCEKVYSDSRKRELSDWRLNNIREITKQIHAIDGSKLVKKGQTYKFAAKTGCGAIDENDQSRAIDVSFDYEIASNAITGLTAHYENHPGENITFDTMLVDWNAKGYTYIGDRAYQKIELLEKLDRHGHWFVFRHNESTISYEVIGDKRLYNEKKFIFDEDISVYLVSEQEVKLGGSQTVSRGYRCRMIRYKYNCSKDGTFKFINIFTNHRFLSAEEVVYLYKCRWKVETSFRNTKFSYGLEELSVKSPESVFAFLLLMICAYFIVLTMFRKLHHSCKPDILPIDIQRTIERILDNATCKSSKDMIDLLFKCSDPSCPHG